MEGDSAYFVLGDNIFYGHSLPKMFAKSIQNVEKENCASVFNYYVDDPERYEVADFDAEGSVVSIEEKPKKPKSNYAIVELIFLF